MRVGVIVDGRGELNALPELFRRLKREAVFLPPLYADLQPKSAPGQIARKAMPAIRILRRHSAERIILLVDRENREDCPPQFAKEIERAFEDLNEGGIRVTIKNRTFENWLIADPDGLARIRGRFRPTQAFRKSVAPDKADRVGDACHLLQRICLGNPYHKRQDPPRIVAAIDIAAAAGNSRSFRRFLRLLGHSRYKNQSKRA